MTDQYAPGGIVTGEPIGVTLDDDECLLDRTMRCIRTDDRHGWEWTELRRLGSVEVRHVRSGCKHLPQHVVPVETGGEVVAHLCTTCDAQLP